MTPALWVACERGLAVVVEELLDRKEVNWKCSDMTGKSCIDIALENCHCEVLKMFEKKGYYKPSVMTRIFTKVKKSVSQNV